MENFYVYVYLDPRKPGKYKYGEYEFDYEPFYVGKGQGERYLRHLTEYVLNNDKNKLKTNKIQKIFKNGKKPVVLKVEEKLSHNKSCELEKYLIKIIGRIELKTGFLTNLTDGGEGSFQRKVSQKTKDKISNSKKGKKPWNKGLTSDSDERVKKYAEKHHIDYTDEVLDKMSQKAKQRCENQEYIKNFISRMNSEEIKEKRRISRLKNKSNIGKNNGRFKKDIDNNLLKKLYLEGNSFYKIQKMTSINNQTVKRHLRIIGVIG